METHASEDAGQVFVQKREITQTQTSRLLVKILTSSDAKDSKIKLAMIPVKEVGSGEYVHEGPTRRFLIDRNRLFSSGRKGDAWCLLPKSILTLEIDRNGEPVALYPPLPKYSEGNKRIVESQEPFYTFR